MKRIVGRLNGVVRNIMIALLSTWSSLAYAEAPAAQPVAQEPSRQIVAATVVTAPAAEVWDAWTTRNGIKGFFAEDARIEPRLNGRYEILFRPKLSAGLRGSEGSRIVGWVPGRFLSFTWNAPPEIPTVRRQRTLVSVYLEPLAANLTRVTIVHGGWGVGPDWDQAYAYFDRAWNRVVIPRLEERFGVPRAR